MHSVFENRFFIIISKSGIYFTQIIKITLIIVKKRFIMKNLSIATSRLATIRLLIVGLALLHSGLLTAQNCNLACNDLLVVEVPTNGTYTLEPAEIAAADLAQLCPGGDFQTQIFVNSVYQPATGNVVFDDSHAGQTFVTRLRDLNSGNACWGEVQVIGEMLQDDTVRFQLCAELWKDNRPMKGTTLVFQPNNPAFPVSPTVFVLDSSQSCVEVTVVLSDYLPDATFSYTAMMPDTGFLNGVDVVDFCKISRHILGVNMLPAPFGLIAADANKSGSITTFDIVEFRKLLIGQYTVLPNNSAWRFVSDYTEFPNPLNPFQGTWKSEISVSELIALNGGVAKVKGIKTGDVDGSVRLLGEPNHAPMVHDSATLLLPQGQIMAGVSLAIPVKFDKDVLVGNLQIQFFIDPALVRFDSVSEGVSNLLNSTIKFYDTLPGQLTLTGWGALNNTIVPAGQPFINIHVTPLQSVELGSAIWLVQDEPTWKNFVLGSDCGHYTSVGFAYAGFVSTQVPDLGGLRVFPPSPNPYSERSFLEISCEKAGSALLELADLTGRVVYAETRTLASGLTRWEIPPTALASGSIGIWRLHVAGQMASGKIVRL